MKDASAAQTLRFKIGGGLRTGDLAVWRSNARQHFVRQADVQVRDGVATLTVEPDSVYSLTTTRGQRKAGFERVRAPRAFPFPYYETFEQYARPREWGYLARYFADIAGAFELTACPGRAGVCLRQMAPVPTIS